MWPFKRKAVTGTPAVIQALNTGWSPTPMLGGGARQRINEVYQQAKTANYGWMYTRSPAVRTVVDTITRNMGQLDLRLYEEIDQSERQPQPDHPAALSMRYPSETVTADEFVRQLFTDYLIAGDAVALMSPAVNSQIMFKWVPISWVQFLGSNVFDADTYRIHNWTTGIYTDFDAESVMHWRGENPNDPIMGLSPLETLRAVVAEDAALQQATVELANSGLTEPVYVYSPLDAPEVSGDTLDRMEEDLANRIKRVNRRPFIMQEGRELKGFGVSPRDAQMLEIRQWAVQQIAIEYGVPLGMVGLDSNVEEARSFFYSDTLPPYSEAFTKFLNQRLCVRVYNDTSLCFEFDLDEKHMGDERLKTLVSASGRAVMTTNEARAKLNLPPIDDGDELVTPLNVIVGDNPKPSPQVMGPQDPNKPEQDGSYRSGEADQQPKALVKAEDRLPQFHPGRAGDLERQHRNIDLASALIVRHYNRLGRSLTSKAAGTKTDWDRWDREFADDLDQYLNDVAEKEGTIYAFKLGGTFHTNRVQNYLRAMAEGTAEAINQTIKADMREYGIDGALGLRDRHAESGGAGLGASVTTWVREEAARQSPGTHTRVKTWIPNTARHAEFGGDTVPLGADWPAGFAPGSAPGCRCSMSID